MSQWHFCKYYYLLYFRLKRKRKEDGKREERGATNKHTVERNLVLYTQVGVHGGLQRLGRGGWVTLSGEEKATFSVRDRVLSSSYGVIRRGLTGVRFWCSGRDSDVGVHRGFWHPCGVVRRPFFRWVTAIFGVVFDVFWSCF